MSDLTDFILARVVEDEAEVDALLGEWGRLADGRRLERQCEAYRRIVEECYVADCIEDDLGTVMERARATPYVGERILRDLASIWSDHPDYRQEWRA